MTIHYTHNNTATKKPLVLSSVEIDKILSMRLIANLATLKTAVFISCPCDFCKSITTFASPTSRHNHKYRNVVSRPVSSAMIDLSRDGLNFKGVLIKGQVELCCGGGLAVAIN